MNQTRHIVLCADDFGQTESICNGILQLVAKKRLSAVSCMVNGKAFVQQAALLKLYQEQIDIGLHLNFTEGEPLSEPLRQQFNNSFPSLGTLSKLLLQRQLAPSAIETEIVSQIAQFEQALGHKPDFIDGHQHVHHFPQIRPALLKVYEQHFPTNAAYIRISVTTPLKWWESFPKKHIIALTGALKLKKQLEQLSIPHNTSFEGIYNFKNAPQYRAFFQKFLRDIQNGGLIMCHPGLATEDTQDPLWHSRFHEFDYFASDAFLEDCADFKIAIGPLKY